METNNYSASSIPNNCEKYLGQFYKKCYGLSRPFILASLPFGCKLPTISSQPDSWNSFLKKSIIPKNQLPPTIFFFFVFFLFSPQFLFGSDSGTTRCATHNKASSARNLAKVVWIENQNPKSKMRDRIQNLTSL